MVKPRRLVACLVAICVVLSLNIARGADDTSKPPPPNSNPSSTSNRTPARQPQRPAAPANPNQLKDLEYAKVGEKSLTLDLFRPTRKPAGKLPVVVYVHGGAWWAGTKAENPALFLLGDGYAVVSINYRLSTEASYPAQLHDCKGAIRWLRANAEKYDLDPDRIGVWGASAGGHLVALLGTTGDNKKLEGDVGGNKEQSSAVQCVVDFFGPSDLTTRIMPKDATKVSPVFMLMGGYTAQEKPDLYLSASPALLVAKHNPPFLIVHGDQDPVVPVTQSKFLHEALTKVGVDSELVVLKGAQHASGEFFTQTMRDRLTTFFDKQLKPSPPAAKKTP